MKMIKKTPRLKPLQLGDIMVAFINQQTAQDHTAKYKAYLGQRWHEEFELHVEEDELKLPEFATADMTHAEILDYQIKNNIRDTGEYERILEKLDAKIKVCMEGYSEKLKEGEEAIEELLQQLRKTCREISMHRKYMNQTIEKVNRNYSRVGPKIHKINNIIKTLSIMQIWGKSKLPYLLSIDVSQPHCYHLTDVFNLIDQAKATIQGNDNSAALRTMLQSLEDKKEAILRSVCENFTEGIIRFTNISQYKIKYEQYLEIREQGLCLDVLTNEGICKILDINARNMFYNILKRITPNANLDMLNETAYLDFFDEVIEEYVIYFRSWHLITTFHLDSQTPYGRLFLETRRQVFITLSEQLSNSLKASNKFISLEYRIKLQLVEKLQDYMEAGEKWMGKCEEITLPKVLTAKLKQEMENVFNLYNNLIKNVLTQEISVMALETVDEGVKVLQPKVVYDVENINYTKISAFLSSSGTRSSHGQNYSLPDYPEVHLKIGLMFIEMIAEYLERAKYLEQDKSIYINKIVEHFEFILFIMFQVCLRDTVSAQVNEDIDKRLKLLTSDDIQNIKVINELARVASRKKKYLEVLEFMNGIGGKYNGVRVAGIIDVNKVFASGNDSIIVGYTKLVLRVVNDLVCILRWLVEALPKSALQGHRRCSQISKIKNVLELVVELILENNMEVISHRYVENMAPILSRLKWEVKKFNQDTAMNYKEYKMKALEIFRNNTLLFIARSEAPGLAGIVEDKEVETLYRSLLECYGKIEKVNDNGRQMVRMDLVEMTKILQEMGVNCSSWSTWFEKYLDFSFERSYKSMLEKIEKVGLLYPPICWKYTILWVIGEISSREKKDYYSQICAIYLQYIRGMQ